MNQLTVNNSNPSKLYVGEGEGTSAFLSGQIVFPSVSGSVTFSGIAQPTDTTLSSDESSVNLSVVFSYDTRNSLAVVLQKEDSSNVMQDVEAVSVTDTRFSGWTSINASVSVSQNVPTNEASNIYQFKFTETVDGTEVTTLSSLMIVRREPELTLTISPSGDQTIRPGEELTLTPTLTISGLSSSEHTGPVFDWHLFPWENSDNTARIFMGVDEHVVSGYAQTADYQFDAATKALTIIGDITNGKKKFRLSVSIQAPRIPTSTHRMKYYTATVDFTVEVTEAEGGYLPVTETLQGAWPHSRSKGVLYGIPLPLRDSTRQQYSEYFNDNEVLYFGQDYDGGYIQDVRLGEYRTQNQPRILLSYITSHPKLPSYIRTYRADEDVVLFSVFTIARGSPDSPYVGNVINSYKRLLRHSQHSDAVFLSAAIDPTKTSAAFGDGRATVTGASGWGGWGVIDIEDYFYTSNATRKVWRFYSQTQTSQKYEFQHPKVKKVLRDVASDPLKIYAFVEHNWIAGSCQIIATVGDGVTSNYRGYGTTVEVEFIRPKNVPTQQGLQGYSDRCSNYISDDFNWVFGVWNEAYLYNKSQFWSSPDMTTGVVQARMVKTNFDNTSDPVFYSSVDIPLDGLPADRFSWSGVSGQFSGDGSTAAVILSLGRSASLGGRVVFYSHDGNGVLTYRSTIVFPVAGHSPVKLSLSNNGQLALLTIRESHPNLGKGRTQLYSRSSASSWVWSEEDSPDGVTVEEKRLVNALPTNSKSSIEQNYDLEGTLSADGNAIMTAQGCVLYEYDDEPDVFGRPQFYAPPVQKHTLFLKVKREEENDA